MVFEATAILGIADLEARIIRNLTLICGFVIVIDAVDRGVAAETGQILSVEHDWGASFEGAARMSCPTGGV